MVSVGQGSVSDLEVLVPDWIRSLRAANRAPNTIATYGEGVRQFVAFAHDTGLPTDAPRVTREHVELF
ncbi:MAG: hypothetical protein ACRDXE_08630, partial [Acidimicrobiales bacterium]